MAKATKTSETSANTSETAAASDAPVGPATHAFEVKAMTSRWRAGRQFGPTPVRIPLDQLTKSEVDAIQADPQLSARVVAMDEPEAQPAA